MNNLYPQLLLLGVLIVFCLIGSMKYSRLEGYTQEELPIPQCDSGACHDDDYILKSQIVPPVCPACPGFGHEKDKKDKEEKEDKRRKRQRRTKRNRKRSRKTRKTRNQTTRK